MSRLLLVFFLISCHALGLSGPYNASAGNIERTCIVPSSERDNPIYEGAFLRIEKVERAKCKIAFSGEIQRGDAARLAEAIRINPNYISDINFDSPGGDAFEGLRIADVLNKNFIRMIAPTYTSNGSCREDQCGRICASACALAFLASDQREGNRVFLHRPSFDQEMFSGLAAREAMIRYDVAVESLREELLAKKVPAHLIQKMMDVPSDQLE